MPMERYKNLGEAHDKPSGIARYEILDEIIRVEFTSKAIYSYSLESVGRGKLDQMKRLARKGVGLNSFIMKEAYRLYSHKFIPNKSEHHPDNNPRDESLR